MLLGVRSESVALDLDIAAAFALSEADNKRDLNRLKSLIKSIAALAASFLGVKTPINDDDDGERTTHNADLSTHEDV